MILRELAYRYPGAGAFALGPLSAALPDDRPCLVLGSTGSGKSTLLRLLSGSLRADAGTISGGDGAAYLPQLPERALAGRNLAEDLCGELRPAHGLRVRLREALARVGLEGVALSRRSRRLSAGERRRLGIALLLLSGHRNWALDEPESGLDARGTAELVRLLGDRARAGAGRMWIATHRFEAYAPLRPWVLVLDGGRPVATGDLRSACAVPAAAEAMSLDHRAPLRLWGEIRTAEPDLGPVTEPLGPEHRLEAVRVLLESRSGLA